MQQLAHGLASAHIRALYLVGNPGTHILRESLQRRQIFGGAGP